MKKSTKMVKKLLALYLIVLMSIESFAAIVSDNDGSAFVTKAEFESLKNDFQSEIEQYNTAIDNKIDGAIANYFGSMINREDTFEALIDLTKFTFYKNIPFAVWKDGGMLKMSGGLTGYYYGNNTEANQYVAKLTKPAERKGVANSIEFIDFEGGDTLAFLRGAYDQIQVIAKYVWAGSWSWAEATSNWKLDGTGMKDYTRNINVASWTSWNSCTDFAIVITTNRAKARLKRLDSINYGQINDELSYAMSTGSTNASIDYVKHDTPEYTTTDVTLTEEFTLASRGGGANKLYYAWTWPYFNQKQYNMISSDIYNYQIYDMLGMKIHLFGGLPICTLNSEATVKFDLICNSDGTDTTEVYIRNSQFENDDSYTQNMKLKVIKNGIEIKNDATPAVLNNNERYTISFIGDAKETYYIKLNTSGTKSKITYMSPISTIDL